MMQGKALFGLALVLSAALALRPVLASESKGVLNPTKNDVLEPETQSSEENSINSPVSASESKESLKVVAKDDGASGPETVTGKEKKSQTNSTSGTDLPSDVDTAASKDDGDAAPPSRAPLKLDLAAAFLYTKGYENGNYAEVISTDNDTISKSHFQAGANTFIIIHGFVSRASEPWIIDLKDKLLEREPGSNVIAVEWTTPIGDNYTEEAYNKTLMYIPPLGASVMRLVNALHLVKSLDYKDVHMIGLNLGAHIAGFAGKDSTLPIGRITGLEPANLGYYDKPAPERLDRTDAAFVDIIHTNSCNNWNVWDDCFGIHLSIGHTDFWPNGGYYQPACKKKKHTGLRCDHTIVTTYFVESFAYTDLDTRFLARPAKNYHSYCVDDVPCGGFIQYMGILADPRSQGDFFLNTSKSQPYALEDTKCHSREYRKVLTDAEIAAIVICVIIIVLLIIFFVLYKVTGIFKKKSDGITDPLLGDGDEDRTNRIVDGQEQPRQSSILGSVARGFADIVHRPVDV